MRATLRGKIDLLSVQVLAELAIWQRRPELQRVCRAAGDGAIDEAQLDAELPGFSPAARENLLRHLEYLDLVDRGRRLTERGRRCAATGEAPSPEYGGYELLVVRHPAFGTAILDFERAQTRSRDWSFDDLEPLPEWLREEPRRVHRSCSGAPSFSVSHFPSPPNTRPRGRVRKSGDADLTCEVDLVASTGTWSVQANLRREDGPGRLQSQPEQIAPGKLRGLVEALDRRWDPQSRRLLMRYDDHAPDGHDDFLRQFEYHDLSLPELGPFNEVTLAEVGVGPESKQAAVHWAASLAIRRVERADRYITPRGWAEGWRDIVVGSPLEHHARPAPPLTQVAGAAGIPARIRWRLSAAADLDME